MLRTVETPERSATRAGAQRRAFRAPKRSPPRRMRGRRDRRRLHAYPTRAIGPESLEHANRPPTPRPSARRLRYEGEGAASDVGHRYEIEGAASGAGFSQTHDH